LNGSVALMSPAEIFRSAWIPARKCAEAPALAIVVPAIVAFALVL
jgi:hypothetical protein